jgi:predicted nucleic acid-binding protein
MIFLDTCIWFELLGVRTPQKGHEERQAAKASALLDSLIEEHKTIVTCKEQMIELISTIEKTTMKSVSKERKANGLSGVGNLKEFRQCSEFSNTKELCETVIEDLTHFACLHDIGNYDMQTILNQLELADINDCLYYDYCRKNNIQLYSFDSDMSALGEYEGLHVM